MQRSIRAFTSLAACAALVLVGSAAGAANYVFSGKFTSNRGKSAQVPLVGLTQAGAKINSCGGLTFMSGPGVAGTVTPTMHPNVVGINDRGMVPKDLGCVPESAPGIKIATAGAGVGGAFTLPVKAFQNNAPMTTINAIGVSTIPGVLQFATNNSVTGPPVARLESPMGTMQTGCVGTGGAKLCANQAKFRAFKAGAWMSQTGRVAAKFTWCPPATVSGMGGPCTKIGAGGFPEIIKYNGVAAGFGGTMSYLTKQVAPGSLIQAGQGGIGIVIPFGTVGQNGMLATLATGRGYADHHIDMLLPASIFKSFAQMTVARPIVGPQKLVTMLGAGPLAMAGTGIAHGWGFPLTTRTVLVRNTGTLGGGPHNSTFTAKGYDKITAMGNRNISLVAGAIGVGLLPPPTGNVPTIDLVTTFMPEPGKTLQLVAGALGLLGIAAWRSRRNR